MMDLLSLYLVNVLRPVFEDPRPPGDKDGEGNQDDDDDDDDGEDNVQKDREFANEKELGALGQVGATGRGRSRRRSRGPSGGGRSNRSESRIRLKSRCLKDIELLDMSGPKLIHGLRSWFLIYQIIGQLNWLGKPLYLSIIYKAILIPTCVYMVWRDFLEPITSASNITDQFKNPIFVFISLGAASTLLLHAILTIYNNLFNLCPLFKVLTTKRLCFVREEVQHIVGSRTMPSMMIFFAANCLLFRMCVARDLADFIHNFDILQFLLDFFVLLCLGYHLIGVSYIDFYIRICFGMWIIAMKTNLEYRFAHLQKHQRRQAAGRARANARKRSSRDALAHAAAPDEDQSSIRSSNSHRPLSAAAEDDSITAAAQAHPGKQSRLLSSGSSVSPCDHMTLADFKAKYKIDTLDEIQRNLNTMDDHLEVSRAFQNSSLVLITLSAFLTNGALLLLAYNLLANQGNYFHGIVVILLAASYTYTVFLCYIGDSWILYALESFVQTVEDEYFLQSAGAGCEGEEFEGELGPDGARGADDWDEAGSTRPRLLTEDTISGYAPSPMTAGPQQEPALTQRPATAGSEAALTGQLAIQQSYQLFMIKKRDVLFCREFLHQFQNHLATPWSKLTVKIQLHMLGTFVTLIAAQIIFDREH